MATCTLATSTGTTSNGPITSSAFTPAANDLLVCFAVGTGTSDTGITCTSTGNTDTWTQVEYRRTETANNNGRMTVWIQDSLAAAVSTTVTVSYPGDNSTGNHIYVYRISGMTNTGSAAKLQSACDENVAAGTPLAATLASNADTNNPTIVFVHDEATAVGWTPPTNWTETATTGERAFSTPSSRTEIAHRDSGFTGTGVTWGNASTGEYTALLIEFDASSGSTDLVIQDATHGHTADNVGLTVPVTDLVIQDATHAHTALEVNAGAAIAIGTDTNPLTGETDNWGTSPMRVAWWNSYQSRWDAVVPLASQGADWWIVADAGGSGTSKVLVDGRTNARPDIVWDDAAKKLYVFMAGATGGSLIYTYDYNSGADTYTVDVNGVATGIDIAGSNSTAVLGRTPNGYLWVAGNDGTSGLQVNRSTDGGTTWGTPFTLKSTAAQGKSGISYFTNGGTTYVLVFTAENGIEVTGPPDAKYHSLYIDQTASGWDTPGNWTDETANLPALGTGEWEADDEVSIARDPGTGNIYVTTEYEILDNTNSPPQWVLYQRTPGGTWTEYVLQTEGPGDGMSARKRPVVTVDTTNAAIFVFAQVAIETKIVYKTRRIASIASIEDESETVAFFTRNKTFRNTHTPENVTGTSDLFAIADNRTDLVAHFNLIPIQSATDLVIADATHAHAADTPALTQVHELAIQDATHAHAADNVALVVDLAIQDAIHGHTADNVAETQEHHLAVQDASHGHTAENLDLTQVHVLAIADATHGHAGDNLALTQEHHLVVADATHGHAADNVVLTESGSTDLVIADAAHAHAADGLTITQAHQLVVADALHAHAGDNLVLTQVHTLAIADALHAHTADSLALTGDDIETAVQQDVVRLRRRRPLGGS